MCTDNEIRRTDGQSLDDQRGSVTNNLNFAAGSPMVAAGVAPERKLMTPVTTLEMTDSEYVWTDTLLSVLPCVDSSSSSRMNAVVVREAEKKTTRTQSAHLAKGQVILIKEDTTRKNNKRQIRNQRVPAPPCNRVRCYAKTILLNGL